MSVINLLYVYAINMKSASFSSIVITFTDDGMELVLNVDPSETAILIKHMIYIYNKISGDTFILSMCDT